MGLYPPPPPDQQPQKMDGGVRESEGKRWVVAGIPLRGKLKPIFTKRGPEKLAAEDDDEGELLTTTPTGEEARVSARPNPPAPPRKRKSAPMCHYGNVREFFTPPDLDTVFIRRVDREGLAS